MLPEELDHQSADDMAQGGDSSVPGERKDTVDVAALEEWHGGGAESIRNVIYGVNDGLTATLGVLSGVGGASVDPRIVLIGGLSAMVASAVSMAGGAYLATKSQREVFEGQLEREAAEIEAMPELSRASARSRWPSSSAAPSCFIGSARSFFTGKSGVRSGLEMLGVGTFVAAVTFGVGILFRA